MSILMTKSELISAITKASTLHSLDVESAMNCMLSHMTNALIKDERIEIRDFGSFNLHHRPARLGRNPKTGESVSLPIKAAIHFKPGKQMRDRVDGSRNKCGIVE